MDDRHHLPGQSAEQINLELDRENKQLKNWLQEERKHHATAELECKRLYGRINSLESRLAAATEALEFYADKENWDDDCSLGQAPTIWDDGRIDMGNRARAALAKPKGVGNG